MCVCVLFVWHLKRSQVVTVASAVCESASHPKSVDATPPLSVFHVASRAPGLARTPQCCLANVVAHAFGSCVFYRVWKDSPTSRFEETSGFWRFNEKIFLRVKKDRLRWKAASPVVTWTNHTHTRHTQIDVNNLLHAMACMYRDEGIDALSLPRVYRDICWMCAREEQCFLENILKGTWFHHGEHLHDMDNFKPLKQPLAWWQFV